MVRAAAMVPWRPAVGDIIRTVKLDQFVEETLLEVMRGVHRAKHAAGHAKGVASGLSAVPAFKIAPMFIKELGALPYVTHEVEFDVAVTVTEQVDTGGKGGVNLGVIQVAGTGSSVTGETSTHRIRFKVPVTFDGEPDQRWVPQHTSAELRAVVPKATDPPKS
jgi:hypothetical protein